MICSLFDRTRRIASIGLLLGIGFLAAGCALTVAGPVRPTESIETVGAATERPETVVAVMDTPVVTSTVVPTFEVSSTPMSEPSAEVPTEVPTPPSSIDHEFVPTPRPASRDRFVVGGIDFADATHPLDVTYPVTMDGEQTHTLEDVDLLLSDAQGTSLATFQDIGSWVGRHKFFVYSDIVIGSPILSVHNGYWSGTPLDSEPLRYALEGSVYTPFPITEVEANLKALIGESFTIEQSGVATEFVIAQAIRMDPDTTREYLYRAGELSRLLTTVDRPEDTVLWMMCSTGQPDEVDEVFPARFVLALTVAP